MKTNFKEAQTSLVSIVLPVYNGEKYLEQSINSIFSQTYHNWELIIINDGSSDNTEKLILKYADQRIKYFFNDGNQGIIFSMNKGLQEAKGEFIARLDADDIALPFRFEKQVEFLKKNKEYALCGSYFKKIDSHGEVLKNVTFPANNKDAQSHLLLDNCFCHSAIMMRSQIAKELKYNHEFKVCEDYDLWYRISRRGKITNLPLFTTLYRVHDNNISTKNREMMFDNVKKLNRQILKDLGIEYSETELEIHSNALCYNTSFFKNSGNLVLLENWILKLFSLIKKNRQYNALIFYKILIEKWLVVSFQSQNYKKMIFNKLASIHPSIYLGILYRKALKRD